MNHGWYEIMDRISIIQNTLEANVRHRQEVDEHLQQLIDSAQEILSEAHQYAGEKWDESCVGDSTSGYNKAKKFISKHGVEFTLNWLSKNIAHTPTHGKYVDIDSELNPKGIISTSYYGGFHVEHLVKLTGYEFGVG